MRLMTKSTAVAEKEAEKTDEEKGEEMSKSFEDVMNGLDSFIKASVIGKDDVAASKPKGGKKAAGDGNMLKGETVTITDDDKKSKKRDDDEDDDDDDDDKEKKHFGKSVEAMAKSLEPEPVKAAAAATELDGEQVFAELKSTLIKAIAKAVVSIKQDLMEHIDEQIHGVQTGQVLVAKALQVNGKLLKEAMHEVAVIGDQPRPRKSVLSVFDKSMSGTVTDTTKPTLDPKAIMAKALALNAEHKLMPSDVGVINHYVQGGLGIPRQFAHLFPEVTQ